MLFLTNDCLFLFSSKIFNLLVTYHIHLLSFLGIRQSLNGPFFLYHLISTNANIDVLIAASVLNMSDLIVNVTSN